jgi:hypothetical protein
MITIKGTGKIKGALDLTGINKQLKAGDALPISDEEFVDHTVQLALSMGFLSYERGGVVEMPTDAVIKVKNIYDRSLRINALDSEVRPGQTFTLTQDQINGSDIRGALAKGYLEIISSARPISEDGESEVRVGNLFEEKKLASPPTQEETPFLETNEEVVDPAVIDTPTPNPVGKDDIPDPKKASIIWNPNKDPIAHTRTAMHAIAANKGEDSFDILSSETNVEVGDISFVDAELDEKRRASHPVLKNKPAEVSDGIDFV